MPTLNETIPILRQKLEALIGKDWTDKIDTLSVQANRLIADTSNALQTTFENVLKETSKARGKLFDTSLARDVTQSKDIAEIYNEYIEQIQKIRNQELTELKNIIPQTTFSNEETEVENAPKHNSEKEARNALRQDIIKKIPEIFLSPLNVAANIVSAILRCLIAIVETAVLGILTLNAQILPEKQKQVELNQIDAYKKFVKVSVIDAKSYSHAILAYATKIKENASTYLETHDNPSYSRDNKEEAKALLGRDSSSKDSSSKDSSTGFEFHGVYNETSRSDKQFDADGEEKYNKNPYSKDEFTKGGKKP